MRPGVLILALSLTAPGAASDGLDAAADPELVRQVDEIEARLDRLEAQTPTGRLAERRAQEIRHLVADVLADAQSRTSLLQEQATAGHGRRFFVASADGRFRAEVSGMIQVRFAYNHQEDGPTSAGFSVRRLKLYVRGHIQSPKLVYRVTVAKRADGTFGLQTVMAEYRPIEGVRVWAGRFRPRLIREGAVSSRRQLLAERSLVARTFNQFRSIGLGARLEKDGHRLLVNFQNAGVSSFPNRGWQGSVRGEVVLWGSRAPLSDLTSFPGDEPAALLGVGVLYSDANLTDPSVLSSTLRWAADLSVEFGGANVLVEVVGNHVDDMAGARLDQLAIVVQGGIFVTDGWELVSRYEWGDSDTGEPPLNIVSIGVNRYFHRHSVKATVDVGYGLDEVVNFWSSAGANWLTDAPGRKGQVVVRAQFQLLF